LDRRKGLSKNGVAAMIDEIKSRFTIPQIGEEFLPDWKSAKCRRSPFRPDKHPGFSVYDEGRKFTDFATGEHGDVIDFYGLAKGISAPEALNALWDRLRNGTGHSSQAHTEHKSRSSGPTGDDPFALPYHLSVNERKVMRTDCERLLTCQEAIDSIASARGWQPDIVRGLALDGVLALSADRCITVNYSSGSKSRWLNANGKRIFC
jgi:hypothetical protein